MIAALTDEMFLDGYILGIIGPATNAMKADMGMSTVDMGLVASAALFTGVHDGHFLAVTPT